MEIKETFHIHFCCTLQYLFISLLLAWCTTMHRARTVQIHESESQSWARDNTAATMRGHDLSSTNCCLFYGIVRCGNRGLNIFRIFLVSEAHTHCCIVVVAKLVNCRLPSFVCPASFKLCFQIVTYKKLFSTYYNLYG